MKATRFVPLAALLPLVLGAVALTAWMVATVGASYFPHWWVELSDYQAGVNAGITDEFSVPASDVSYHVEVTYTPVDWRVASDADVPDGTLVGSLEIAQTFGLAIGQGTCNTMLAPSFDLYDCTTAGPAFVSTGDLVAGTWNGYDLACPGQGNGERQICEYPDFLDDLFPVRPRARYCGHAIVIPGLEEATNVLVFDPGADLGGIPSEPGWGYATIKVLNDTGVEHPAQPTALADYCAPVSRTTTILGEADSIPVRTNPQYGGAYTFRSWSLGLPDADGDGFENRLDTCPYDVNLGNSRVQGPLGDGDQDGLDAVCDPNDNQPNSDQDADAYHNRADNCPLVPNGPAAGQTNQADADGDDIGDVCDQDPSTVDGVRPDFTIEIDVNISGPPRPSPTPQPTPTPEPTPTPTPPPSPIDYGVVNLVPPSLSFANPGRFGFKVAVFTATAENLGTQARSASLSLRLDRVNRTCRAPFVFPISRYSLALEPGDHAQRAWLVLFRSCDNPSPPVDYIATAAVSAPGDSNPTNDALSATVNVRRR
ncbi:MAG TPA: thrombospondin type 3 repeat-containing protein [Dehalococcoidia bacterium]|nr:thrombospondin type 3 repeat-containing protein [Dehalococcoidia bacterium]